MKKILYWRNIHITKFIKLKQSERILFESLLLYIIIYIINEKKNKQRKYLIFNQEKY